MLLILFLSFILISGKPFYQNEDQPEESGGFLEGNNIQIGSPARSSPHSQGSDNGERFSRKVFVGGLPPDIDEGKKTLLNEFVTSDSACAYSITTRLESNAKRMKKETEINLNSISFLSKF